MRILAILFLITLFVSCSENENIISTTTQQITPNENSCAYSINGDIHNQVLDAILQSYKSRDRWTYSEIFESLKTFVKNQRNLINTEGGYSLTESDMENIVETMETVLPYIVNNEVDSIELYMIDNGVSTSLVNQFKEVSEILTEDYATFEEGITAIETYETSLVNSGNMTSILQESIYVLKSSLCYWNSNVESWSEIDYVDTQGQYRDFWGTINGMAKADFWSFAVGTCMAGPAGGVAGGCYGSAAKGISDVVTGACC